MNDNGAPLLVLDHVHTYYGNSHVLQGVSFQIHSGGILGLFGRNGVGKTTTIQTIIGFPSPRSGDIFFKNNSVSQLPTHEIIRKGVGWVPQGRRIFTTLTVEENLILAATIRRPGKWSLESVYNQFPILLSRRKNPGKNLSGGEQQMLAIARSLIQNPELILMDEPSEGLAPIIMGQTSELIMQLNAEGCAILLVEQNLSFGLPLTRDVLVMNKGQIIFKGTSKVLSEDVEILRQYLGVTAKSND